MHRIKRAIIMAAGLGNRMKPVTLKTPKPLVVVNGVRIIDTVIEALHENEIYEILNKIAARWSAKAVAQFYFY